MVEITEEQAEILAKAEKAQVSRKAYNQARSKAISTLIEKYRPEYESYLKQFTS